MRAHQHCHFYIKETKQKSHPMNIYAFAHLNYNHL